MFLPEKIDLAHSEKYILSIRIGSDSFMFTISDPENPKNFCFRETKLSSEGQLTENIQRIIFDLNFLTQQFKKTNVVFVSDEYELVPQQYYVAKQSEALYNFSHMGEDDGEKIILSLENTSQRTFMLYPAYRSLYEFLIRNLFNPTFYHHSSLLIQYFEEKSQSGNSDKRMYLYFHGKQMDIYSYSGHRLIHSISHKNKSVNNSLYHVLKIWEDMSFDQIEDYLFISGQCSNDITLVLKEYIKHIDTYTLPSEVHLWNEDAEKTPLDLLVLSL